MSLRLADLSNHQEGLTMQTLHDAGHPAVILKASEGATYRDPITPAWREEAHALGMVVGLYHYARGNPVGAEVDNFMRCIGELRDGEFAVLDWEDNEAFGSAEAQAWLELVEAATGVRPLLYSYAPYLAARPTANLLRWPLWIAAYGKNDGEEHPWPNTDRWTPFQDGIGSPPFEGRSVIWQFTSNGSVPGWDGRLDLNRFDGSEADLRALAKSSGPAPAPTPQPPRAVTFGWREIHSYARYKLGDKAADPTPAQSYGGVHTPSSLHYQDSDYPEPPQPQGTDGCACDYGDANSDPQACFDLFRPLAVPGGPIVELIYQHTIIKNGVESYYSPNDHGDHCHIGIAPSAHLPFDIPPAPADIIKEDPVFMFGLPNDGGIWLAWAGKRWYLDKMGQVDALAAKGVPYVDNWPEGNKIPVGA